MKVLADTNVLARLLNPADPTQPIVLAALAQLDQAGHEVCLVHQVLYELWVVCTRPEPENGMGFPPAEAHAAIQRATEFFRPLRDERGVFDRWSSLVVETSVCGKAAHDARLAAAMQRHGVSHLLTFNVRHFSRFAELTVWAPGEVAAWNGT